jgi:hypothetical protein
LPAGIEGWREDKREAEIADAVRHFEASGGRTLFMGAIVGYGCVVAYGARPVLYSVRGLRDESPPVQHMREGSAVWRMGRRKMNAKHFIAPRHRDAD